MGYTTQLDADGKRRSYPTAKTGDWYPNAKLPAGNTTNDRAVKIYVTGSVSLADGGIALDFGDGAGYVEFGAMSQGLYDLQPVGWSGSSGTLVANQTAGVVVFIYGGH